MGEFSWFNDDPSDGPGPRGGAPALRSGADGPFDDSFDGPFAGPFDDTLDDTFDPVFDGPPERPDSAAVTAAANRAVDAAIAARQAVWRGIGDVDADMLGPAIDPAFLGGPEWPAGRQAFLRVRRSGSVLLASDGLSDPHLQPELAEPGLSGFGLEVFLEATDPVLAHDGIESVVGTWAFHLLYEMAQNVAYMGDVAERLDALDIVSMELQDFSIGPGWDTPEGSVGVLLGVPTDGLPVGVVTGSGGARFVAVTLLRPAELAHVASGRPESRAEVAQLLADAGVHHRCDLSRRPVV